MFFPILLPLVLLSSTKATLVLKDPSHFISCSVLLRDVGRSENLWGVGAINNVVGIIYPQLAKIGLTNLPKFGGGGVAPLVPAQFFLADVTEPRKQEISFPNA